MLIIGTRGSELALWQAHHVRDLLRERAGLAAEIRIIRTEGDRVQDRSLGEMPGIGFFTREIENALLARDVHIAVHSHKDLPTEAPLELAVAAVPERGPVRDLLLIRPEAHDPDAPELPLREGARVGTGSARRRSLLRALRPDLRPADLRGNVPTRMARLAEDPAGTEPLDAIVLAEAGLARLGLDPAPLRVALLDPERFVPAPAQGALAIQVHRAARIPERGALVDALAPLHHEETASAVSAERRVLAGLEGGCNLPLGVLARTVPGGLRLVGALGRPDGTMARCDIVAPDPETAAREALNRLRS
ncbi:MAG: hydroxymethylbilane synthase [Candidatus Krumholzibacteriia bacterium]